MANNTGMAEHHASVTVDAPVHQVYSMFTHFNDFPKFMSFVKEVTYYDDQRSHWVAEVAGHHEWDAVNENWVEDQQVGWHSTNGLENFGRVTFQPMGALQTRVDVFINYNPPAGVLGDIGENLGIGSRFDSTLQHDLDNFARMVQQAPPGALDPTSSNYLFHEDSAAAKGATTQRQNETMGDQSNYPQGNYPQSDYSQGSYSQQQSNSPQSDYQQGGYSQQQSSSPQSDYQQGNYPQQQGNYQQGNYPQSDYQQGNYPQQQSNYPQQQGNYQPNVGTTYSAGTASDSMTDPGTRYTSDTPNTDYATNRPAMDRDIISGNTPRDRENVTPMPPDTGTSNPVMPPDRDRTDY
jgi:uncharacterized membrane protein